MTKLIALHSFRAGTGRTHLIASFAALTAAQGRRVAVINTSLRAPSLGALFGFNEDAVPCTFHSAIDGACEFWQAAYEVTPRTNPPMTGRVYLIPSRPTAEQQAHAWRDGYDPDVLWDLLMDLADHLALDAIFLDMDSGLDVATMSLVALADSLVVLLRHDKRDYQATGIVVDLARELEVPEVYVLMNEAPPHFDRAELEAQAEEVYHAPLIGVLPYTDDMVALPNGEIFALSHPNHANTAIMRRIVNTLFADTASDTATD